MTIYIIKNNKTGVMSVSSEYIQIKIEFNYDDFNELFDLSNMDKIKEVFIRNIKNILFDKIEKNYLKDIHRFRFIFLGSGCGAPRILKSNIVDVQINDEKIKYIINGSEEDYIQLATLIFDETIQFCFRSNDEVRLISIESRLGYVSPICDEGAFENARRLKNAWFSFKRTLKEPTYKDFENFLERYNKYGYDYMINCINKVKV